MEFFIQHCRIAFENNGSIVVSLFLGGLIGSLTHCSVMCGPLVFAQLKPDAKPKNSILLPYHLGRIVTYVGLGVVAAGFSQFLVGTEIQRLVASVLLALAGLIFLFHAIPALKQRYKFQLPNGYVNLFQRATGRVLPVLLNTTHAPSRFLTGVLLGFLPCGLVVAAVMAVAATGDVLTAAIGMMAFGIGTVPILVSIGLGAEMMKSRWPNQTKIASTWAMAFSGLALMVTGYGLLTSGLTL
ncbi:sulfite exporter TauE/SafE family protein [Kordiimonas sp. SCSIO 12610]|uniref:sulfite exporter TauE/SafE family protein n=1 Tax=Kordiimonas sp. SCSIO 12610 TaxID=2829597 RepID=UPI002109FC8E|nr:sulfite exporter TauE/SafE family protein [Kordiimonas sp. SCSIO 12610]UTW55586.1 sulfite exporter TauE/SafE family protein [Kordiimonas sp. SCSIO 12610]